MSQERLSGLTTQLSSMFGQSAQPIMATTLTAAQQPAVKKFLNHEIPADDTAILSILKKLRPDSTWVIAELLDKNRRPVLQSVLPGKNITVDRDSVIAFLSPGSGSCKIGKLYSVSDTIYYPVVAPVSAEGQVTGYLIRWRLQLTSARSIALFSQLIGSNAHFNIGNADGSLWTDLIKVVPPPSVTEQQLLHLAEYKRPDQQAVIASAQAVPNTPWLVLVEFPKKVVMTEASGFLTRTIVIGILLILIGSFITWLLSRNITRPVNKLTALAAAITKGDFSQRIKMSRGDEIGELARAFNTMLAQVQNVHQKLEQAVKDRTAELEKNITRLKESEEKFHKAFQASAAGITITRLPDSRYVDVNDSFIKMSGYPREELIGRTSVELGLTTDLERREAAKQTVIKNGSIRNYELTFIHKSGKQFDILSSADMILLNGEKYIINILYDITDRKRNQAIIQKQKQDIQDFIDSMSTLCAKVATDGTLLLVNKIAAQASGLSLEELMQTNFLEGKWWKYDQDVHTRVNDAFKRACEGTSINYDESIFVFGKVLPINFSLTPIFDPQGKVEYIVAEARDITALKSTQADLQQQSAELEKANKELEAFSYSVSHDLRAPLRIIDGYVEIVKTDYKNKLDEDGQNMLHIIATNARKMGQLIDDLLDLSRLGRKELLIHQVDMKRLIEAVISEHFSRDTDHANIQVDKLETTECDSNLIRQVWINLISNAIKYSAKREKPEIKISSYKKDAQIVYCIRDNGVGFDMQYADKLFGVFQRLHKMSEYEGTGVGLALVQRIVSKHGGTVWAEAEKDKGATFYFGLPDVKDKSNYNAPTNHQNNIPI